MRSEMHTGWIGPLWLGACIDKPAFGVWRKELRRGAWVVAVSVGPVSFGFGWWRKNLN